MKPQSLCEQISSEIAMLHENALKAKEEPIFGGLGLCKVFYQREDFYQRERHRASFEERDRGSGREPG